MNRIALIILCFITSFYSLANPLDWGRTGHRATGEIAEKHLTKKAKKAIDKLLNGQSLAMVSTFGDEIRSDDRYRKFDPWHYVNFPFNSTYEDTPRSEKGDLYAGIHYCVSVLKDTKASQEDKTFYLKMLVHFIGDLHQPLHVGLAEDKGGNDIQVRWFNDGTNLHTVWDTKMIEEYNMSYTELEANAQHLTKSQIEYLQDSTIRDWMYESRAICKDIYANTKSGDKLSYRYMYDYMDVIRGQLQKGGVRLAGLLNDIFG